MEDTKDFSDVDLNGLKISTLLNEQNDEKGKEIISQEIDSDNIIKEDVDNKKIKDEQNANVQFISNNYKNKKNRFIDNPYESYVYVFVDYLIQSLISLGLYYLFYKLKFEDEGIKFRMCALGIILVFIVCICYMSRAKFNSRNEKLSNIGLTISINIFKIVFDLLFYLIIVSDKENDGIDFTHFEARIYWKFSMCIFYLFLLFYAYFTRKKNNINIYVYLIAAVVCLVICFILVLRTQKYSDNIFRIINYTGFIALELFFVIYAIYYEHKQKKFFLYLEIKINIRVNRIDYLRFGFFIFSVLGKIFKYCTKKCGCFRKTK